MFFFWKLNSGADFMPWSQFSSLKALVAQLGLAVLVRCSLRSWFQSKGILQSVLGGKKTLL